MSSSSFSSRWISLVRARVITCAPGSDPAIPGLAPAAQTRHHQPVRTQISQPHRIRDIGLTAGHMRAALALTSITGSVFEQVIKRLPVVRGGFDHHTANARPAGAHATPGSEQSLIPTCSPSSTCRVDPAPEPVHTAWRPSWRHQAPHTADESPPRLITPSIQNSCRRACSGESEIRQQSPSRAHRQHSTTLVQPQGRSPLPSCSPCSPATQTQRAPPKHPYSVDPTGSTTQPRNHAEPRALIFIPHGGAPPPSTARAADQASCFCS